VLAQPRQGRRPRHSRLHELHPRAGCGDAVHQHVGVGRSRGAPGEQALAVEVAERDRLRRRQPVVGRCGQGRRRGAERRAVDLRGAVERPGEHEVDGTIPQEPRDVAWADLEDLHAQLRRSLSQHPDHLLEHDRAHRRGGPHPHPAREALANGAGPGERRVGRGQGVAARFQQCRARRRQPHLARSALEQVDLELPLEPPDGLRDGLLGHVQLRCRPGEVQLLGHRDEGAELAEVRHRAHRQPRAVA
jgi:hypothetical protein